MPRALSLLPLVCALVLAACGGGGGAADADPASAVPAGTALYLEGVVRPEGDRREDVLDAAGKLLRTDDPERKLRELVDKGLKDADNGPLSYERDFEPWLGEKAGVWLTGLNRPKPGYVVIVAAKDTEAAQDAIDASVKREGRKVQARSFEGVDYHLDQDGVAAGIVGDFFTVGTEAEFKRTVKAADGDSLAEEERYSDSIGDLEADRLGHFFVELEPLFEQAAGSAAGARAQLDQVRSLFPFDQLGPIVGAFVANGDRLALDTVTSAKSAGALKAFGLLTGTGTTPLLGELPGDSWAAFGAPKVGDTVKGIFERVAGALGGAAAQQQLQQRYGIDLQRDVFGLVGDVAIFVRGTTKADVDGAVVLSVTDAERGKQTFGKVVAILRSEGGADPQPVRIDGAESAFRVASEDTPKPFVLARGGDRWVVAYGEQAAADALSPGEKLADSDLFGQAKTVLGGDYEPSFLLSMPQLVAAIQASDPDPQFAKAKPYLDAFTVVAGGSRTDGNKAKQRIVAGLK
jgi:hypothetical protein